MKKIFLMLFAVCAFAACDPIHEKIGNGGHISVEELIAKTTVTVDKAASGQNGNVITCETLAPVNAKWDIGGKEFVSNYAKKKMKLGSYSVKLNAICADGTELTAEFPVTCSEITDPLQKFYIFGGPDIQQGLHLFSDFHWQVLGLDHILGRTRHLLTFDIIAAEEGKFIWGDDFGCTVRVMNGWWSATYADNVPLQVGLWELPITDDMAKDCAKGGDSKDLDLLMTRGSVTIKSVYYEE